MKKNLVRHGNSLALVLDKPLLELLKIDETTLLELSTPDGKSLNIRPAQTAERRKKFEKAMAETNKKLKRTLKNLA